jgi:hypothetical protein
MTGLAVAITTTTPVPLKTLRKIPGGLAAAIHRCLAKKPEERFSTIAELCAALAPFASNRAGGSLERIRSRRWSAPESVPPPPRAAEAPRSSHARTVAEAKAESSGASGSGEAILTVFLLAALGAVLLVAWLWANGRIKPSEPAAATETIDAVIESAVATPHVAPSSVSPATSAGSAAPAPSSSGPKPASTLPGKKRLPGERSPYGARYDYTPSYERPDNPYNADPPARDLTGEEMDDGAE